MGEHQPPTLESITQMTTGFMLKKEPYGSMIRTMQETGFRTWGFVIYRGTYSDDALWQRYMDEMKEQIRNELDRYGREELLMQYLSFTVIEDPSLEGASKDDIRKRFADWVAENNFDHPYLRGHPFPGLSRNPIPRFTHCLYVDQKCLDTLPIYEAWRDTGRAGIDLFVTSVIIDLDCKAGGRGRGGFPEVDGCTKSYPGWMYMCVDCIPEIYNTLSFEGLMDGYKSYARPPLIYPGHGHGASMPT
ncbi:hypothetical protein PT974_07400 [Cladobotryum mycophilum]|uniref:Uncharacterized protein n=1 Tax=Cladobotryum mycophilum TaxID=491253 RepID=A0ABR0SPY9_9HYPO